MKKVLVTIVIVVLIEAFGSLLIVYSGAYDIGTSNHDGALINWALDTGMTRSVKKHAAGITAPALSDPAMVREGFEHYREMCAGCHGAPGQPAGDIAEGLWPTAPDLAKTVPEWTPSQLFWITKHGVKFTAMPAWGPSHSDSKIWAMVAFLEKLPHLSADQYEELARTNAPADTASSIAPKPRPTSGTASNH